MAKPRGAMSSPFTGFAEEMKKSGVFDTIGTEQNLKSKNQTQKGEKVEEVISETKTDMNFTSDEISQIISNVVKISEIVSANPSGIKVKIGTLQLNITKDE